jgi:hypothetical protein
MSTTYEVIVDYDDEAVEQPVAWSETRPGDYEGWTVFPQEYRARPTDPDAAVALIVNGEIIAVQRSIEADAARAANQEEG